MSFTPEQKHKKRISTFPVIINTNSLVPSTFNNRYRYQFPQGAVSLENSQIAVSRVSVYYSWFNITAENNNNLISLIWYDNAGSTQYDITIDDGFYDIAALNYYLQQFMITNGLYLLDAAGDYVYYIELEENLVYYSIQFNSYPIPTALPAGYTNPAGITFPAVASTPQIIINSTDSFGDIIGFNAGIYPNPIQTTIYSKLSDNTPQVSVVQSLILTCSLLNNLYSIPNTALYSFSPSNVSFGSLIDSEPTEHEYIEVEDGQYPYLEVELLDQSFNPIFIRDTNLIIQLMVRSEIPDY